MVVKNIESLEAEMAVSRRRFLGTVAGGSLALTPPGRVAEAMQSSRDVFAHGVASGDPLEDRVILWTRVSGGRGDIEVHWWVANDPEMRTIIGRGSVVTNSARDFTVKVEASSLRPGTTYYYQFSGLDVPSPIGRTKTLPVGDIDSVRLAVVSCSNLPHGYFNVYRCLAQRPDLDAVLHLGDYLYEYKNGQDGDGTALNRVPMPDKEVVTLQDYRIRHAQYKADLDSQAMLRQHPLIAVWDDHESANDSWMDGAENHDPDQGEGDWLKRRTASVKAYYEWMPIRENRSAQQLQIYRSFRFGDLVDLIMLDTRLTGRDEQVDRDNNLAVQDSNRSLLGDTQEAWLFGELEESMKNGTQWRVLGQQVFFGAQAPRDEIRNSDKWDGYQGNRNRIFDFIEKHTLENLVVLTGDIHSSWALDVPRDPWGAYDSTTGLGSLAVEFVTPAVSSPSQFTTRPEEADAAHQARMVASPHLKFVDQVHRGYFILDITPERAQADWYFVSTVATRSTAQRFIRGFYTSAGSNHLTEATRPMASRLDVPLLAP